MAFKHYEKVKHTRKWLKSAKSTTFHSEDQRFDQAKKEAAKNHTWARFRPSSNKGTLDLQIDVAAAISAKLALS